jgi:hypothetical protein
MHTCRHIGVDVWDLKLVQAPNEVDVGCSYRGEQISRGSVKAERGARCRSLGSKFNTLQ